MSVSYVRSGIYLDFASLWLLPASLRIFKAHQGKSADFLAFWRRVDYVDVRVRYSI